MKKIPSLFQRNYDGDRLVRDAVVPGSEWVIAGEGEPTEKIDGTAAAVIGGRLFKRYDVKKGRAVPAGAIPCQDPDPVTGHWPHWVAVGDGPEDAAFREAWARRDAEWLRKDATYELVGPKVQGNPYGLSIHALARHGSILLSDAPRTFAEIRAYLSVPHFGHVVEGIVWHHPDGRMVKIKRKDFGLPWPALTTEEE